MVHHGSIVSWVNRQSTRKLHLVLRLCEYQGWKITREGLVINSENMVRAALLKSGLSAEEILERQKYARVSIM